MKGVVGIVAAVLALAGCGSQSAPKWPTEAQARGQVRQLVGAKVGATIDNVDYCVAGVKDNTFDCQVMMSNVTEAHPESQPTFWSLRCDPVAQTCQIVGG